jgi:hypothetical protein
VNRAHRRHVDHQAAIVRAESGRTVATVAKGEIQSVLASEVDARDDVRHLLGTKDRQRTLVEHAVVHSARLVVIIIGCADHAATHLLTQGPDTKPHGRVLRRDLCHRHASLHRPAAR